MIGLFELGYADDWDVFYSKLDSTQRSRIWKKIEQLKMLQKKARHLKKGLPYFVVEAGQYRITFKEEGTKRTVYFAGTHKQYDRWCKEREQKLR